MWVRLGGLTGDEQESAIEMLDSPGIIPARQFDQEVTHTHIFKTHTYLKQTNRLIYFEIFGSLLIIHYSLRPYCILI
jgi:hypothetical protein